MVSLNESARLCFLELTLRPMLLPDENRTLLLTHQLPQSLLGLLFILDSSSSPVKTHYPLIKSSLGALLNISLEHGEPQNSSLRVFRFDF